MGSEQDKLDVFAVVGKLLGEHYLVVRQIGEGGMGVVYELRQVDIGRRAAAKFLKTHGMKNRKVIIERFIREAKIVAALSHTGIVTVWDLAWFDDQTPYIIMDFVDGRPFGDVLAEAVCVPWTVAFDIVARACDPLEAAHAAGCTHRDLKPANILITPTGEVKLLDFGVAHVGDAVRLTQTGFPVGTPLYMSREQVACAKDIDGRADIYSLGVVLYHAITGRPIYEAKNQFDLLRQMASGVPADIGELVDLPDHVLSTIRKAMAPERDDRFPTIKEFASALRASLEAGAGALKAAPDAKTAERVADFRSAPTRDEGLAGSAAMIADDDLPNVVARRSGADGAGNNLSTAVPGSVRMPKRARREPPSGRRLALVAGGVLLGLAVPAGIAVALWRRETFNPQPAVSTAVPQSPAAPLAEPATRRWVRVVTTPEGASVERDGVSTGTTPVIVDRHGNRDEPVTIRLSLPGYVSRVEEILPMVEGGDAEFRLTRKRVPSDPAPVARPAQKASDKESGIKANDALGTNPFGE